MEKFLKCISEQYNLNLIPNSGNVTIKSKQHKKVGWEICLPTRGEINCLLNIGPEASEFYVTISDVTTKEELWSDWMDYYGYEFFAKEEKLLKDKQRDLKYFIDNWISSTDIRLRKSKLKSIKVEWCHNDNWSEIIICDPNR